VQPLPGLVLPLAALLGHRQQEPDGRTGLFVQGAGRFELLDCTLVILRPVKSGPGGAGEGITVLVQRSRLPRQAQRDGIIRQAVRSQTAGPDQRPRRLRVERFAVAVDFAAADVGVASGFMRT
jgi:hypothetical protein